jgi:hypothetical protein
VENEKTLSDKKNELMEAEAKQSEISRIIASKEFENKEVIPSGFR